MGEFKVGRNPIEMKRANGKGQQGASAGASQIQQAANDSWTEAQQGLQSQKAYGFEMLQLESTWL